MYIPKELRHPEVSLHFQVLDRMIDYFGYLPITLKEALSAEVREVLMAVESSYENGEEFHLFNDWAKNHLPELGMKVNLEYLDDDFKAFIGKAVKMDPDARSSVAVLSADPWLSS